MKEKNSFANLFQCQQRRVLSQALHLIRFPLMTVEEFAVGPAQSGILEDREVVELFLHFTVNPKPSVSFSDVPRCCLTGKEQVVSRFCQIESRWGYSGTSDRIRYAVVWWCFQQILKWCWLLIGYLCFQYAESFYNSMSSSDLRIQNRTTISEIKILISFMFRLLEQRWFL